jgi:hypothetical protein
MSDVSTAAPTGAAPASAATPAPPADPTKAVATPAPQADPKPPEPKPEVDKSKMEALRLRSELKRQTEALTAKQKEFETANARLQAIEDAKASGKPALALKALGFDDAKIADLLVNGGEPEDKVTKLEQQLAEMSQKLGDYQKRFDTAQSEREQELSKAKESELTAQRKAFVDRYHAQEDKYPLLASTQNGALILAEINRHHEETGEVIDPDEAAARVEKHLAANVPAQIDGFLAKGPLRELIKARLAALEPAAPPATDAAKPPEPKPPETPPETRKLEPPSRQKWQIRAPTLSGSMQRGTPPPIGGKTSKDEVWKQVKSKYPAR